MVATQHTQVWKISYTEWAPNTLLQPFCFVRDDPTQDAPAATASPPNRA